MTEAQVDIERLIRSAQAGDAAAFRSLIQHVYDQMYRCALKFTGDVPDAEDVTQQACMKLARNLGQYRFEASFDTWLYRLVVNCGKDWLKLASNRAHAELEDDMSTVTQDSSNDVYLQQVLLKVTGFGEGFRETLVLVLGEGLSHKDAAAVLGVKESTISWRIHEIRKRLVEMEGQA